MGPVGFEPTTNGSMSLAEGFPVFLLSRFCNRLPGREAVRCPGYLDRLTHYAVKLEVSGGHCIDGASVGLITWRGRVSEFDPRSVPTVGSFDIPPKYREEPALALPASTSSLEDRRRS